MKIISSGVWLGLAFLSIVNALHIITVLYLERRGIEVVVEGRDLTKDNWRVPLKLTVLVGLGWVLYIITRRI